MLVVLIFSFPSTISALARGLPGLSPDQCFSSFSELLNHLQILLKHMFWVHGWGGAQEFPFQTDPWWHWCCWFKNHTLNSKVFAYFYRPPASLPFIPTNHYIAVTILGKNFVWSFLSIKLPRRYNYPGSHESFMPNSSQCTPIPQTHILNSNPTLLCAPKTLLSFFWDLIHSFD